MKRRYEYEADMRRMRKQPSAGYNPWNFDLEAGDRVYDPQPELECCYIYDLVESRGRNKSAAGELTPVLVKKNGYPRRGVLGDGVWYWDD